MNNHDPVSTLTVHDWPAARRLILTCFPQVGADSLRRSLCEDRQHGRVVRIDGALVGMINLRLPDRSNRAWLGEGTLWINSISVAPAYRGAGIGRLLMGWAHGYARERGLRQVGLSVQRTNAVAISLYQKLGYATLPGEETEPLRMSLEVPPQDTVVPQTGSKLAVNPLHALVPARLRNLPEKAAYRLMCDFQDHIQPWFSLDPFVTTGNRR